MSNSYTISATFSRWTKAGSPKSEESTYRKKSLLPGWFAVSHRLYEENERPRIRGKWFRITSPHGQCFRALSMDPTLNAGKTDDLAQINIDWDGWLSLSDLEDVTQSLELKIEPVRVWDMFHVGLSHPDPAIKVAAKIANISIVIALISLAISVAQLF